MGKGSLLKWASKKIQGQPKTQTWLPKGQISKQVSVEHCSQSGNFDLLSVTQLFTPFPTKELGPTLNPSWLDLDYKG